MNFQMFKLVLEEKQRSQRSNSQLLGASETNPTRDKVWVQGAGTQRHLDLRGFLRTIHSQALVLSSSDAWSSSMFPKT